VRLYPYIYIYIYIRDIPDTRYQDTEPSEILNRDRDIVAAVRWAARNLNIPVKKKFLKFFEV
jgi:hypothetical protein